MDYTDFEVEHGNDVDGMFFSLKTLLGVLGRVRGHRRLVLNFQIVRRALL